MNLDALNLKPEEVKAIRAALPTMTKAAKQELMEMLEVFEERESRNALHNSRLNMIDFAKKVYPGFKVGPHHRKLAKIFQDVIDGKKKRVIINIAPRMGKSEFASYLFPAYFLGNYPNKKIIMGTHTASLSEDFGRRVRNLLEDEDYNTVFPGTKLAQDQKASGKWSTDTGGQYYASGVGGALAGRGADLFLIDDFRINLPMIAAFLTLVGYSLNDTIVMFDRIREVRGKNPAITVPMVNLALNQTLGRTILTATTVFIVVFILYACGGAGVHGFAWCLLVGCIAGTYSSIYIASPILIWALNRVQGTVKA